ncbi:hypothetical protein PWG71_17335 [Nocardiopsis sp. N85]|uniref:hypothetical protein n=1 Tax=Nocardiopsis sp. N85 TaxID=3029400 RepID=UPI00237F6C90|nr:hypothetical protein [Nocardiopsis sp. N85]MDE3723158.1 hypothetical protein [Nocardiopsis sp. N85]
MAAEADPVMSAMQSFERSGNEVLGYLIGLGALLGVLALIIIAGRMIHANFTGDPWIAARGMAELPWVVLGVVLLIAGAAVAAALLQGSRHETQRDLGEIFSCMIDAQSAREHDAGSGDEDDEDDEEEEKRVESC